MLRILIYKIPPAPSIAVTHNQATPKPTHTSPHAPRSARWTRRGRRKRSPRLQQPTSLSTDLPSIAESINLPVPWSFSCHTPPPRASPPMTWSPSTSRSTPRLPCRGRASEPPAMQPRWRSPHLLYWIVRSLFSLLYNPMYKVRKLLRHTSTKNFNLRIIGNAP